jgi:GTP cyclohydrolase II
VNPRDALLARVHAPDTEVPTDRARIVAVAGLPTRFGDFQIAAFQDPLDATGGEHVALVHGRVDDVGEVTVRLHSECLTGDAFGSLRCDCRDQLEAALTRISEQPCGVLIYLRQEGRGIGLVNKVRAYALQDAGLDTVDANLALGFLDDERDYAVAARMLSALGVDRVRLMTNNPKKIDQLRANGVDVVGRLEHTLPPNPHNRAYLLTKQHRSGHLLKLRPEPGDTPE